MVKAIVGNKIVPGWLDHPDNLWHPARGDFGAHGDFDARAAGASLQLWANMHRAPLAPAAGPALALGVLAAWKRGT